MIVLSDLDMYKPIPDLMYHWCGCLIGHLVIQFDESATQKCQNAVNFPDGYTVLLDRIADVLGMRPEFVLPRSSAETLIQSARKDPRDDGIGSPLGECLPCTSNTASLSFVFFVIVWTVASPELCKEKPEKSELDE